MNLAQWAGLAAATLAGAAVQGASGFGFAVLATPFYLLFVEPAAAIQIVILVTTVLSVAVLRGIERDLAWPLLLRLVVGCFAGLPIGLAGFAVSDPGAVRLAVGATILVFSVLLAVSRKGGATRRPITFGMSPRRDVAAGLVSGVLTALVGMSGPPLLIYLVLADVPVATVRATLLAFFAISYTATAAFHAATVGIPARIWVAAGILLPFAVLGGLAGRGLGGRLGQEAFALLAIGLLAASGVYTLVAALFAPA